ncbi:nitric oxide reductase activation protein NorD [Polynucleobacter sp. MWH-CaK5]|uniref:nitric oxide reductase activation protein NorD n=1 Tax=Polynucleobacter sp. MWH-CaK5 TaxID=2689107 RepID=UPI001BFE9211|nr:nitric oxide reductase activation protein NorD [Polynucleobacter sp. MWH-CaK5]QWD89449.1 nitric oxide reductase activation protein NorD [Polynucleobacter sp. MWH-CaK5]
MTISSSIQPFPSICSNELEKFREALDCRFPQVDDVFHDCVVEAKTILSDTGINAYIEAGRFLGKMGRGPEPLLIFLQEWPQVAAIIGERSLSKVMDCIKLIWKSPNSKAINNLLQSLAAITRRLPSEDQLKDYLEITIDHMNRTSTSIHGIHKTYASPSLPEFFNSSPRLLEVLSIEGLKHWVNYGIKNYHHHPEQQKEFFSLRSADSLAVVQRERYGTLLVDHIKELDLYLLGLWEDSDYLIPFSTSLEETKQLSPYFDDQGIRLPDVYVARAGVSGINRYRAALAHMAGHRLWTQAIFADNFSPLQRMAIEFFEDCRIDYLVMQRYPGIRSIFRALHPNPDQGACDSSKESCIRHRLATLSWAIMNHRTECKDSTDNFFDCPAITEYREKFLTLMQQGQSSTAEISNLALSFVAKTRLQSDQLPNVYFENTEVDYRDDNRHMWNFYELSDDEEMFDKKSSSVESEEIHHLPPRHYPEWDESSQTYRPDWVSLYERLHPSGASIDVDRLLEKHRDLAKRLKKLLDLLKPQDKTRVRYQEEGSELDLDIAIRSLIDLKTGTQPDSRINMSHKSNGRNIAVMVLLDLSESLNEKVHGSGQTILELSQEAVSLLAWSIQQLGDPFAIAGFNSNTRHDVNYMHIKGFSEQWNDDVKARIAAMEASYSTRMGAAMRHAAHYLNQQTADKKLLLVLTDGKPSDIDVKDENILIADARQSVKELSNEGIYTYCINLDPQADEYVADIFGKKYTIIDQLEKLPEQLPKVFMSLTA